MKVWQSPLSYIRLGHHLLYQLLSPEFEKILGPGLKYPDWREMDNSPSGK